MALALLLARSQSSNLDFMLLADPTNEESPVERSSSARRVSPTFASMESIVNTTRYESLSEASHHFCPRQRAGGVPDRATYPGLVIQSNLTGLTPSVKVIAVEFVRIENTAEESIE